LSATGQMRIAFGWNCLEDAIDLGFVLWSLQLAQVFGGPLARVAFFQGGDEAAKPVHESAQSGFGYGIAAVFLDEHAVGRDLQASAGRQERYVAGRGQRVQSAVIAALYVDNFTALAFSSQPLEIDA